MTVKQEKLLDVPATHRPVYRPVVFSIQYELYPMAFDGLNDDEMWQLISEEVPLEAHSQRKELLAEVKESVANVSYVPIESPL